MFLWQDGCRIFLSLGFTDMRKSINALSILVESEMGGKLFSGDLFVFCNRNRSIMKVLYWDQNGFCLWQKRLEEHRFKWPKSPGEVLEIGNRELEWLLDGFDIAQAHDKLTYSLVS